MASEAPPLEAVAVGERRDTMRSTPVAERIVAIVGRRWWGVLLLLLALEALILLYYGRGLTFYYDEWEFILRDYGGGPHVLLLPHVGNISVFPIISYKILFHLAGLNHYAVYRIEVIALHLIGATLIFALSARRIGHVPALVATSAVLFLGAVWEDLLWAFQVGYMLSIVGGLATWLLLEREDRLGDLAATVCLIIAMGSSSLGIALMIGIAVELAWRRQWSRTYVVAIPAVLYVLWYLGYGVSQVTSESLRHTPGYAVDLAAAAFGGLVGHDLDWGRPLALLGMFAVIRRLVGPGHLSARLMGLLATAISLWILTGLARSTISPVESSRYIYLGVVAIVLIGVELLVGAYISARAIATATALVLLFVLAGLPMLRSGSSYLWETSHTVAAELGALQIAAAYAPPTYAPDPTLAPPVTAGPYLHTVRSIGSSPADSPARIVASDPASRASADRVLLALEPPKLTPILAIAAPPLASAPPHVMSIVGGSARMDGPCVTLTPSSAIAMTVVLALPTSGVLIRVRGADSAKLAARRFGEAFVPIASSQAHRVATLVAPSDAIAQRIPWQVQLNSSSWLRVCKLNDSR